MNWHTSALTEITRHTEKKTLGRSEGTWQVGACAAPMDCYQTKPATKKLYERLYEHKRKIAGIHEL